VSYTDSTDEDKVPKARIVALENKPKQGKKGVSANAHAYAHARRDDKAETARQRHKDRARGTE
jgi:hypothetical protein